MNTDRIRLLNDRFRQTFTGGRVVMSAGVAALSDDIKSDVFVKVREFTEFNDDNDPHGEHNFGRFELYGQTFFWKVDYYDERMKWGSDDPADYKKTTRVLTVMFSEEY